MIQGNVIYKSPEWKFKVHIKKSVWKNVAAPHQEYFALLIARNGEVVFCSETQTSKATIIKTVNRLFPGVKIIDKTIPNKVKK
jgi:uncharacterized protein YegP (UPF0339 family)